MDDQEMNLRLAQDLTEELINGLNNLQYILSGAVADADGKDGEKISVSYCVFSIAGQLLESMAGSVKELDKRIATEIVRNIY